jgi:GAF domain-containing protein
MNDDGEGANNTEQDAGVEEHEHFEALVAVQLSRIVMANEPLDVVLRQVSDIARRLVPGAEAVSIALIEGDRPRTAAYVGQLALELDEPQYAGDHGPGIEAARSGIALHIRDMADDTRWPDFASRAAKAGALSLLAIPLPVQKQVIGALNVYATRAEAFTDSDLDLARTFAAHAAVALANARLIVSSRAAAADMANAMASRAVIEQAKGIVMGDQHCSADRAFAYLREISQTTHRKLRDVAQDLVDETAESEAV